MGALPHQLLGLPFLFAPFPVRGAAAMANGKPSALGVDGKTADGARMLERSRLRFFRHPEVSDAPGRAGPQARTRGNTVQPTGAETCGLFDCTLG